MKWKKMTSALFIGLLVFLMSCGQTPAATPVPTPAATARIQQQSVRTKEGSTLPDMLEQASPAVVGISTETLQLGAFPSENQVVQGVGTGVLVTQDGYILTNQHVASQDADKLTVVFYDGTQVEGTTLWSDASLDLAVVKIEGSGYPTLPMGDSNGLRVGDNVVAIGTPLGLMFQHTVTAGIVSAKNRTLAVETSLGGQTLMEDLIQTDASINPGNSGGPLVNMQGEIVGINTLKVDTAEGIGFAIPIEVARPIVERFASGDTFETPYVGFLAYDKEIATFYGLDRLETGVYVVNVDSNGPAYQAGIRSGDVITAVDGATVDTMVDFRRTVFQKQPGDTITASVLRRGKLREIAIRLIEYPG